ncbi:ARM repeat-containing protein [Sparassis latifolia]
MNTAFLPVLAPGDAERAAQLILQAYAPQNHLTSEDQRRLQQELFDIQKRPEAWGLVLPFLDHTDPNVQFFGAHTAQVKIARDWDSIAPDDVLQLRDMLINITGRSIALRRNKVILRKLYVAITSLALKLCPGSPSRWPDWLIYTVGTLSSLGVPSEHLLDFLAIVSEEIETADMLGTSKAHMQKTLQDAVPMVTQAIASCITIPREQRSSRDVSSALKCLQAWCGVLPANALGPLIPLLISLLDPISTAPIDFDETTFISSSDTIQEVMTQSAYSAAGSRTLTEPLLLWLDRYGSLIVEDTLHSGFADEVSHSFCKLLAAIGEHSTMYLASKITSPAPPEPTPSSLPLPSPLPTRSHLVQKYLKLMLDYTALPGYYGADEEESELTLGFWYLFQEALWSVEYDTEYGQDDPNAVPEHKQEEGQWTIAKVVYFELVKVLRRKAAWPEASVLSRWARDQRDKFQAYRRDVADALVNAYYVLRNDMLAYYADTVIQLLSTRQASQGWEEIEGILHCIMAVQEAVPLEDNAQLRKVFGPQILGRLPSTGSSRVRRTALLLIGSYNSWFTTQPAQSPDSPTSSLLMNAISYVVSALDQSALCLPAANALRDLCDANRSALAPHIGAFGQLHANLIGVPDTEKSKVLQSIASVIQGLPPMEEITPVEAIINPVVAKLFEALQSSTQLPEEARVVAIQQLQTIAGAARGLTRTTDSLLIFDESPAVQAEANQMQQARNDPRMVELRDAILRAFRITVELWSTDASVSDALSDVFRAITSLPFDVTLLTLQPGPLLELVCMAAQTQLTSVWLSLATMLIIQLDPPMLIPTTFKSIPAAAAEGIVLNVLGILSQTVLTYLSRPGAMEANPDIIQDFFTCTDMIAQHFVATFYRLPPDLFNALIQCAITSLGLQERYSLVSACTFLGALINRTAAVDELGGAKMMLGQTHGKSIMAALLHGFAGDAPRSASQNLIELLSALVIRYPADSKGWMTETLYANDFIQSKATNEAKDKFVKAVFGSRSLKRTREAAQQFTLVARGLEGSSFGYTSVTM